MGVKAKNLSYNRILDLIEASLEFQKPSNDTLLISFMGAGEGFLNISGLIQTALDLNKLNHDFYDDGFAKNHFTCKKCGIFAYFNTKDNLFVFTDNNDDDHIVENLTCEEYQIKLIIE